MVDGGEMDSVDKPGNYPSTTPTRIFWTFFDFYGPFLGQEGFKNDPEPYGSVQS